MMKLSSKGEDAHGHPPGREVAPTPESKARSVSAGAPAHPISTETLPSPADPRRRMAAPAWVGNKYRTWLFLKRAFPKQDSNERQEFRAHRWAEVIRLFFVEGKTRKETAQSLGCSVEIVRAIIQRIRFVDSGLRQDGKPHTGRRKGRPRTRPRKRRKHKNKKQSPSVLPEPTSYTPEWEVDDDDQDDEGDDPDPGNDGEDELESDDGEVAEG